VQSCIQAGDGGFDVKVNGNTELVGGAQVQITSTFAQQAARRSLSTPTPSTGNSKTRTRPRRANGQKAVLTAWLPTR